MNSILKGLPKIYSESGDITDYLQHIYDAVNDIDLDLLRKYIMGEIKAF